MTVPFSEADPSRSTNQSAVRRPAGSCGGVGLGVREAPELSSGGAHPLRITFARCEALRPSVALSFEAGNFLGVLLGDARTLAPRRVRTTRRPVCDGHVSGRCGSAFDAHTPREAGPFAATTVCAGDLPACAPPLQCAAVDGYQRVPDRCAVAAPEPDPPPADVPEPSKADTDDGFAGSVGVWSGLAAAVVLVLAMVVFVAHERDSYNTAPGGEFL